MGLIIASALKTAFGILRAWGLGVGLWLLLPAWASAQTGGTLSGTVTDRTTGESVAGATVFIVGTYKGAVTDEDGAFEILEINPGEYSVRITFSGYADQVVNGVRITEGQTTALNPTLLGQGLTTNTVEILGEANLVDLDNGQSTVTVGQDQIRNMSVQNVQDIAAMQVGVNVTPDGLQIRGGRVYETQYLVEGVSAQDPLAGTGFGLDVGAGAIQELEVITGGAGAEYSGGTAGVVSTRIREGGNSFFTEGSYSRDNLGFNKNQGFSWNTDNLSLSVGGPILRDRLSFFVSGSMRLTDEFMNVRANQLYSSWLSDTAQSRIWAPRQDNRWSGTAKLSWKIKPGMRLTFSFQQSLNINQNTRSLQIIGNDQIMTPGYQFSHSLNLDNANTYTHATNLMVLGYQTTLGNKWVMNISVGRLFTNLRADANGRPFRDANPGQVYDPRSIVTDPTTVFNPNDSIIYVNPGPGLFNNGGIATLWHDHYAQEYTGKVKFSYKPSNEVHYFTMGWEHKEMEYQWIDVTRPWLGAPIQVNDSVTYSSNRIGLTNDIWSANPAEGGIFFQDNIRYKGIVATVGLRFSYWAMGQFADDAVANPNAPVLDQIRREYLDESVDLGRRFKARLLPKLNVSFPVTDNNVLYFNYSHALRMPHPRFVYAGLDPVYQNNSFLSNLGNPNINPETTVSYELGLKTQFNRNTALTFTAFYNDKFDFIVNRSVTVRDFTGRFVEKSFYINQDYARIRGLEIGFYKRIGAWFQGSLTGSYTLATGKSNSAYESLLQIQQTGRTFTTTERPLAWDRPLDIKLLGIFTPDSSIRWARNFRVFLSATFKSGFRYTPYIFEELDDASGRPRYVIDDTRPYEKIGAPWFWMDIRITRDFHFGASRRFFLSAFVGVENIFNNKNTQIINPITGRGWEPGDPVPDTYRDPAYPHPLDNGDPPNNPARYLQPRHLLFGASFNFAGAERPRVPRSVPNDNDTPATN